MSSNWSMPVLLHAAQSCIHHSRLSDRDVFATYTIERQKSKPEVPTVVIHINHILSWLSDQNALQISKDHECKHYAM